MRGAAPEPALSPDPRLAELELELEESRQVVAQLLTRLTKERRRWKASLLGVRRRLKHVKKGREASSRIEGLSEELEESRASVAALMLELTRQRRSAEAERRRRTRGLQLRRAAGVRPLSGASVREAVEGAAERLERLLAEAAGPARAETALAGCLAMVRLLKLASLVSAPPRAIPVFGGDLKDLLERALERWEPELSRRGLLMIPAIEPKLQPALLDERSMDAVLDELIGRAADRLPRRGVVMLSAGAARDGGLRLELKDDGQGARRRSEGIEELGLALSCALVEGWGGMLGVSATPSGRGQQVSMRLLPG